MITVTATQQAKPGQEAALESLMQGLTEKIASQEPGCARFEYLRSADEGCYIVIEQYIDEDAFESHKNTSYLKEFIPQLLALLQSPPGVTVYRDVPNQTQVRRPPSASTYFHVGVVVRDLAEAMKRYSAMLGLTFTEPARFHVPQLESTSEPYDVVGVFSREGPPYYELIQAAPDGPFSAAAADRILYVGVWEPDVPARVARLRELGVEFEALLESSEGEPFVCLTRPEFLEGLRVEFVSTAAQAGIEHWVRTGRWTGSVSD